jgi:hypothetical protein
MRTTTRLFVIGLTLVIVGLPAHAIVGTDPTWTADANGCKVWNTHPQAGETVTWSGACKDGFADGPGILQWQPGSRTEAPFVKGKPSGKGSSVSASGGRFEGTFVDGEPSGKGVYTWANGDRYEGDFVDGKLTGKGIHISAAGARYEGEWLDDKRNGNGTQVFDDGSRYTGQWKDNKPLNPEAIERKTYSMKESVLGSQLKRDAVKNVAVPIDKTFAQLTPQERLLVKAPYGPMGADDEPPYPLYGLRKTFEASIKLAGALRVRGELVLAVNVDSTGQPISVEVIDSPDKEMTKRMAAVLMLDKYKPAVCSGAPCKKQYWFRMNFVDDL